MVGSFRLCLANDRELISRRLGRRIPLRGQRRDYSELSFDQGGNLLEL